MRRNSRIEYIDKVINVDHRPSDVRRAVIRPLIPALLVLFVNSSLPCRMPAYGAMDRGGFLLMSRADAVKLAAAKVTSK